MFQMNTNIEWLQKQIEKEEELIKKGWNGSVSAGEFFVDMAKITNGGKTSFSIEAAKKALDEGKTMFWVDTELETDDLWEKWMSRNEAIEE